MKKILLIVLIIIGYLLSGYVFISSLLNIIYKAYVAGSFYTLSGLITLLSLSSLIFIALIVISIILFKKYHNYKQN